MRLKIFLLLLIFFFNFSLSSVYADDHDGKRVFVKEDYVSKKDSLSLLYSHNKKFLPKIELQALIALSFYPELKDVKIVFKRKRLKTTMAARPTYGSLLKRRKNRTYVIYLNDFPDVDVPFDSTSFNAQVGIIGHELAHIIDYESMTKFELVMLGIKYKNKKFRAEMEANTDIRTIYRGLGWQVWAFEHFVSTYPQTPKEYKLYKSKIYLSTEDIIGYIKEYEKSLEEVEIENPEKLSSK